MSAVGRSSSSRPRGALRRVERCWPGAAQARRPETDSVRRTCSTQARRRAGLTAPATLEEAQRRALLRQATLLALAGDTAPLAALGAEFAPRLAGGPLEEPFVALTADPPRRLADLPRLQRELQLFRSFPARLEPLRAAGLATR